MRSVTRATARGSSTKGCHVSPADAGSRTEYGSVSGNRLGDCSITPSTYRLTVPPWPASPVTSPDDALRENIVPSQKASSVAPKSAAAPAQADPLTRMHTVSI